MTDPNFYRRQYQCFGYTVFTNLIADGLVKAMIERLQSAKTADLVAGDESAHSWRELPLEVTDFPDPMPWQTQVLEVLGDAPTKAVHWLNIYRENEYIGAHVDAGGEAQLMIPIEMPPAGSGGEIWIGSRGHIVPLSVGDVLLFAAHRKRHGTTKVAQGTRVSLNVRMWLADQG